MDKLVQPPPYSEHDPADNDGITQNTYHTANIATIFQPQYQYPDTTAQGSSQQINIHPIHPGYDVSDGTVRVGSVAVVTVATDTENTPKRTCLHKMSLGLSISQLTMGIIFSLSQLTQSCLGSALSVGQGGFIVGAVFMGSGIFGIMAYRTGKRAYVIALLALSIGSLIASLAMMPVQLIDMLVTTVLATHADRSREWLRARIAINVVFLAGSFVQSILALWASIVACETMCSCCGTVTMHSNVVAHYSHCSDAMVPQQIQAPHVIQEPAILQVQPCGSQQRTSGNYVEIRPNAPYPDTLEDYDKQYLEGMPVIN